MKFGARFGVNFGEQIPACPVDMRHAAKVHQKLSFSKRRSQILPRLVQRWNSGPGNLSFDLHGYAFTIRLLDRHSHWFS